MCDYHMVKLLKRDNSCGLSRFGFCMSVNVLPICDVGCPAYERVGAVVAEGKHRDKNPCAR